jgi:SAV_6107-like HEPN
VRSTISLLSQARVLLADAAATGDPGERFRLAHFAALRTAAALLGERDVAARRRRLVSIWTVLEHAAPEHASWARHFAAGASVRAAVEAGVSGAASAAVADEQLRTAQAFLAMAEASAGMLAA